ncbi:MAG: hypothetical protein KAJ44_06205, partial [Thermoplasmatales archaeon]|nr:hypothetical protein [Thermoplasmatales archaeon]
MKRNKISIGTGVLLIAAFLVFSSLDVTADTDTNRLATDPPEKPHTWVAEQKLSYSSGTGQIIFEQLPWDPNDPVVGYFSDDDQGFRCYDDFWDLVDPISDVHWWGLESYDDNDPTGSTFGIEFYNDAGGIPDLANPVAAFEGVAGVDIGIIDTGVIYLGAYNLYYLEFGLPSDVNMASGWLGIWKQQSGGNERWVWIEGWGNNYCYQNLDLYTDHDYAFQLTGVPEPSLSVNVTGGFGLTATITNSGSVDATNVNADFTIAGGFFLLPPGGSKTVAVGTISKDGGTGTAKCMVFGIGK